MTITKAQVEALEKTREEIAKRLEKSEKLEKLLKHGWTMNPKAQGAKSHADECKKLLPPSEAHQLTDMGLLDKDTEHRWMDALPSSEYLRKGFELGISAAEPIIWADEKAKNHAELLKVAEVARTDAIREVVEWLQTYGGFTGESMNGIMCTHINKDAWQAFLYYLRMVSKLITKELER